MSFDAPPARHQRIAIIGGGISGLATALLLAPRHRVTLFEAAPRLGGHARTVMAGQRGDQPVDTGFIVFNYANYPHLTRMFADLEVPVERSNMSFGASLDGGRVEYGLRSLNALFSQRRNLASPGFLAMIRDILRFNTRAEAAAEQGDPTVDELIAGLGLSQRFRSHYLLPICGAIWSAPAEEVGAFPARSLLRFMRNHALLSASGQHQWWTVKGGSVEYVRRLADRLTLLGVELRTGCQVQSVRRGPDGVTVRPQAGVPETFDEVVLACHSDQALALLSDATAEERAALSAIAYRPNRVVLHRDAGQMPQRRSCWSAWVYRSESTANSVGVTYWMNRLQNIPESDPLFVTLNAARPIPDAAIYDEVTFDHPVFDRAALAAQERIARRNGTNRTWFAGAWLRWGFHEDGFASAMRIARQMERVPA